MSITPTISVIELTWMAINVIGLLVNLAGLRDARRALIAFQSDADTDRRHLARRVMVRQNLRNGRGRVLFNIGFLIVGVSAMLRVNSPPTVTSLVFTGVLVAVVSGMAYLDVREYLDRRELFRLIRRSPAERTRSTD